MIKKSNIRPWDRKKTSTPYRKAVFSQNRNILIVCEGQTEALYFESFDVVQLQVVCEDTKGLTKRQLVEWASEKVKEYKNKEHREFDEVWCVFDMDIKRGKDQYADYDGAISSAHAKGYKVAHSNDAFELWFYLHYQFTDQANHRTFYYDKLSKQWSINYEKNGKARAFCMTNYDRLQTDSKADQQKAIQRAEKLCDNNTHLPYSQRNPVTTVHLLVRVLNEHLRGVKRS